ncbi:PREDICTED: jerky protein homolog-like [Dufourea novaeangliae]|uniref:jerky protein homolog-like n=1 Tax=Dufourea novaeangliae TaxID=178035 RepID=UPI000766F458|nr:PREDICTED: jerky protein homolog-like [Dufourea novaeangliae]
MNSSQPSTSGVNCAKRRIHVTVTLQQKVEALKQKDAGVPTSDIAVQYNVNDSTVRRWVRDRKKLEKCGSFALTSKRMRLSPLKKVNEALTIWFNSERKQNEIIGVTEIKAKAQQFFERFGGMEIFKVSDGWFHGWKKKNGIRLLVNCGEQVSTDTEAAVNFKNQLLELIEEEKLKLNQIFNADETGLYFKMMPKNTLVIKTENSTAGYGTIKDRVTVMACCNATGSLKMPLLIVGRHQKPGPLKNLMPHLLPVKYISQSNACMNITIFETWFKEDFVPNVVTFLRSKGLPEKAILLHDNAKSYSSPKILSVGGIRAISLPPNVTSLIQPLDQGIIAAMKRRYKTKLLRYILNAQNNGQDYNDAMKSFNIKYAINFISDAWNEITEKTISNGWKNLLNQSVDSTSISDEITSEYIYQISKKIRNLQNVTLDEVTEWVDLDSDNITDEDIIRAVQDSDSEEIETEDDDPADTEISPSSALEAADCLISFCEKNQIFIPHMTGLRAVRDQILQLKDDI